MRRVAAAVAAGTLVAAALVATVQVEEARAATAQEILKAFDPADIIADEVMYNPDTMSAADIQSFLNAKVPTCTGAQRGTGQPCLKDYKQDTVSRAADPMCKAFTGKKAETAASIIKRVATACGVNPQTLLVTLQKEQSLVTDTWPTARQYRSATGYGCPDTAPCDAQFYGFYNQVYKAAWAFKRYTTPPGTEGPGWTKFNWFPVGKPVNVQYNPKASCGAKSITIKNKATATLYYFTPYQPNAAAKAAGWGTGDGCSAYGNRNFFLYFTSWFGSTHYTVTGDIAAAWKAAGGANGPLGKAVTNAVAVKDAGGGTMQRFQHGRIYASAAGAHAVSGAVLTEYLDEGGPKGELGWPRRAQSTRTDNGGGVLQAFQKGAVYASPAGAHTVAGELYSAYSDHANQAGALGWPVADAEETTEGTLQRFRTGTLYTRDGNDPIAVTGAVFVKYLALGSESSNLGWPTAAARASTLGGGGTEQRFDGGGISVTPAGTFTVTGRLDTKHQALGGVDGSYGWPTGPAARRAENGAGWTQVFAGGVIYYSPTGGTWALKKRTLVEYQRLGGPASELGWPTSDPARQVLHGRGGTVTTFQAGAVYATTKWGAFAVQGEILDEYLEREGPAGELGWPLSSEKRISSTKQQQTFQFGTITWSEKDGAVVKR